jgi:hypothetical protein
MRSNVVSAPFLIFFRLDDAVAIADDSRLCSKLVDVSSRSP